MAAAREKQRLKGWEDVPLAAPREGREDFDRMAGKVEGRITCPPEKKASFLPREGGQLPPPSFRIKQVHLARI